MQQVLKDANIPGVGQDVFCRKSSRHDDPALPLIAIYPNSESISRFDEAPKRYKRFYDVVIEIITKHNTDELLCDELDDLSYYVEEAIESDSVLQGIVPHDDDGKKCFEDTELTSISYDMQADGSSPIGLCRMSYSVSYVDQPYIEVIDNNFETVESKWKIGDHGDNQAVDNFDIPQE